MAGSPVCAFEREQDAEQMAEALMCASDGEVRVFEVPLVGSDGAIPVDLKSAPRLASHAREAL